MVDYRIQESDITATRVRKELKTFHRLLTLSRTPRDRRVSLCRNKVSNLAVARQVTELYWVTRHAAHIANIVLNAREN